MIVLSLVWRIIFALRWLLPLFTMIAVDYKRTRCEPNVYQNRVYAFVDCIWMHLNVERNVQCGIIWEIGVHLQTISVVKQQQCHHVILTLFAIDLDEKTIQCILHANRRFGRETRNKKWMEKLKVNKINAYSNMFIIRYNIASISQLLLCHPYQCVQQFILFYFVLFLNICWKFSLLHVVC